MKKKKEIDLHDKRIYNLDYANCSLTCVNRATKAKNILISGIIKAGLCFTLPLILPDLDLSHLGTNVFNFSTLARQHCKDFRYQCEEQLRKNMMEELERVPQHFHSLTFHKAIFNTTSVNALSLQTQAHHLWHQHLIHCGEFNFKDLHTKVDEIPKLNKFEIDELSK